MTKADKRKLLFIFREKIKMAVITITNLKELEERGVLELDDIVEFTVKEEVIGYKVRSRFLNHLNISNDKIFEVLKISEINKYKLAEKAYGYILDGAWPSSKTDDFPALTRLVKELYKIIEKGKPVYTKFTRFEIMEI